MKRQLHNVLERFLAIFSAIKDNTPLFVYHSGYDTDGAIDSLSIKFNEYVMNQLFESYMESPGLDKESYIKVILSLAFYYGLVNLLRSNGVEKYNHTAGIELQELKRSFEPIYETLGLTLNKAILSHETERLSKEENKITSEWMKVLSLLRGDQEKVSSPNKRNFFAHAGFESNVTECQATKGKVFVRYDDKYRETIKKWLCFSA